MYYSVELPNGIFSQTEIQYLKSQRIARIATVSVSSEDIKSMQPDVMPVGYDFDGEYICEWNEYSKVYQIQEYSEKQQGCSRDR